MVAVFVHRRLLPFLESYETVRVKALRFIFLQCTSIIFHQCVFLSIHLKCGRCYGVVEARLLRFWETRNLKRGGEPSGFDILMMGVTGSIILARIGVDCLPLFRGRLTAGLVYSVSTFDVDPCGYRLRLSDGPLMMRFTETTVMDALADRCTAMPVEGFRFCSEAELLLLANTHSRLPDVVGELLSVKSTVCEPLKGKNHVMATIRLDSVGSVILSLFDSQAISFHRRLESMTVNPSIVVASSINPRMVGGRLFLNATSGTHIYFEGEKSVGQFHYNRLVGSDPELLDAAPLLGEIPKVETLTIAELNIFATIALSEEIEFMCIGSVTRVDTANGWCYVGCTRCSRELKRTESGFSCVRCEKINAVGVVRYRVGLAITDDTAEGDFVCYDGVMTKFHNLEAHEAGVMVVGEGVNPEDSPIPGFISDMEGKTFAFHVRLDTYNFTAEH